MEPTSADDLSRLRALLTSVRDFALRAKRSLDDEIGSYPTPIPRCDAQFNHAYAQRARLAALLQRIGADVTIDVGADALLSAMTEFAALPAIGEMDEERALRARIADALSRAGVSIAASADRSTVELASDGH
jgi:hypothetical protein